MNNMNNFGLNNIAMNNIGMNNINFGMNNIGLNNFGMNDNELNNIRDNNMDMNQTNINAQHNLMDENALRVKNIIQLYENKIRELEEIIRQKDFEIAVLKDKLNNVENPNLLNMNQINMMMQFPNQKIDERGKEIVVSYTNYLNTIVPKKFKCFDNDMAYKLFDKIRGNYHWKLIKLYCNEKAIHPFLTIKENGIKDGSIIKGSFVLNILFKNSNDGIQINIVADGNYAFKKVVKYYLLRIGKEGLFLEYKYYFNGRRLYIEDKTPIKAIFGGNANIFVE